MQAQLRRKIPLRRVCRDWTRFHQYPLPQLRGRCPTPLCGLHFFQGLPCIEKCWLQDDISNQIRNTIRDYAYEHNLAFYNIRNHEGVLRNLMIRTSSTGELMVLLQVRVSCDKDLDDTKALLAHVAEKFPQITSLLYVVNNKCNDTINDLDVEVFKGNDHIFEEMEGLRFKVGPKSFYQTNSEQAYNLYKVARDFAGLTGDELVYDLYTGTGTIANFVSRKAKKVIGIATPRSINL